MKTKFTILILSLMCLSIFNRIFAQNSTDDKMNILFIGNSYTHMNNMPGIFEKIAKNKKQNIYVEKNTHSGFTFKEHCEREDMWKALKSKSWTHVVLQGFSREFTKDYQELDTASIPYMMRILDTIYSVNPCAEVFLYMTWGYQDGWSEVATIDSFPKMTEKIWYGYQYVNDILETRIIPVGLVWKTLREKHPDINLYDKDLQHPNRNGSYLAACTFYSAIFQETPEGAITSTIGTDDAKIIQKLSFDYIKQNSSGLNLKKNTFSINVLDKKDEKFYVKCSANFPNAKSITWDFGNGSVSKNKEVTYQYPEAGKYVVKLTVVETCGTKTFSKSISYKIIKKKAVQKSKNK